MGNKLAILGLVPAAILAVVVSPVRVGADVFDVYGCGARGMAMANSLLTQTDDPCAFYYNPARVPMISHYFTVGYNTVFDSLYIDTRNPATKPSGDIPNTHGVVVGLASSLGIPRFRMGALVYSPVNRLQLQHSYYTDESEYFLTNRLYFSLVGDVSQVQTVIIGGGYQILRSLSIGLGFSVSIVTTLNESIYQPDFLEQEVIFINMDSAQSNEVAPLVGIFVRFTEMVSLGFSFRGKSAFPIKGEARVRGGLGGVSLPPDPDDYFVQEINAYLFYTPDKFSGGCGLRLSSSLNLELGLDWMRWSQFKNTHEISLDAPEDPPIRDSANLRIGVEKVDAKDRRFWAGVMYVPSPVPDQTRRQNLVDNDRAALSLGIGYPLKFAGKEIRGDLACQWQHLMRREVTKIEAFDADPDTEAIENPGYPGYTSGGDLVAVKATVNYSF